MQLAGYGEYTESENSLEKGFEEDPIEQCNSYLSKGKWQLSNFTKSQWNNPEAINALQNVQFSPNTTVKLSLNQNGLIKWQPFSSCQNKIYNSDSLHQCLKSNYEVIQIYGDSRSLRYWNGFREVLTYNNSVGPEENQPHQKIYRHYYEDSPKTGITLRQDWFASPEGVKEHLQGGPGSMYVWASGLLGI